MFRIIPREEVFFDLFDQAATNVHTGAQALREMLERFDDLVGRSRRIKELEHAGDQLTHQAIERLNRSFITPIDREDIHELACRLDDVLDLSDTAADRITLCKFECVLPEALELARTIERQTALILEMMPLLRDTKDANLVRLKVLEVHRLESEADQIERRAIASLFESADPMHVIKWQHVIATLELATDRCEDVSNVIEGIVLKNA
jgi:predicted phosphate transport protein (TIGR00153 family)